MEKKNGNSNQKKDDQKVNEQFENNGVQQKGGNDKISFYTNANEVPMTAATMVNGTGTAINKVTGQSIERSPSCSYAMYKNLSHNK